MMQTQRDNASHKPALWWMTWLAWDGAGIAFAASEGTLAAPSVLIEQHGLAVVGLWFAGSVSLLALAMAASFRARRRSMKR
jgi:hypothetical protein